MASSHLRSSSSFPNHLLSTLNFFIFILSSASLVPVFLLRTPPTAFGWALFTTSSLSLFSSFVAFYSLLLRHPCLLSHCVSREPSSWVSSALLARGTEHSGCGFAAEPARGEDADQDVEKAETTRKRSRRMARVQEESILNAAKMAEVRAKELDEKMNSKYGVTLKIET